MMVRDVMQPEVIVVGEDDSMASAQELMRWGGVRHLPVIHRVQNVVRGLLSDRDVQRAIAMDRSRADVLSDPVHLHMSQPVQSIDPNAALATAAAVMTTKELGCLPVIEFDKLAGIITTSDLLGSMAQVPVPATAEGANKASRRDVRSILGDPRFVITPEYVPEHLRQLRMEQVMNVAICIAEDSPLSKAVSVLVEAHVGALPVVDAGGTLRGIVSYVDLLRGLS